MKILILEDQDNKYDSIHATVIEVVPNATITRVDNFMAYHTAIASLHYDLILLDLVVKRSREDRDSGDFTNLIVEETRHIDSKSFITPAIVLTQYLENSDEALYNKLNSANINAIHFDISSDRWRTALKTKILGSIPAIRFDIAIICALRSEADAYAHIIPDLGEWETISELSCRRFVSNDKSAVIVSCSRMGLVNAAVTTAHVLERFEPSLVVMSGICGGVPGETTIYDTWVFKVCHQHDAGKWTNAGFEREHYDIQIPSSTERALEQLIRSPATVDFMKSGVVLQSRERFKKSTILNFNLDFAITSSGSSVMAEALKTAELADGQRKLTAFDMEVYSVYEACRMSPISPKFFAVKSVVDDGGKNKGDKFHRVGCLLSARFVTYALENGRLL